MPSIARSMNEFDNASSISSRPYFDIRFDVRGSSRSFCRYSRGLISAPEEPEEKALRRRNALNRSGMCVFSESLARNFNVLLEILGLARILAKRTSALWCRLTILRAVRGPMYSYSGTSYRVRRPTGPKRCFEGKRSLGTEETAITREGGASLHTALTLIVLELRDPIELVSASSNNPRRIVLFCVPLIPSRTVMRFLFFELGGKATIRFWSRGKLNERKSVICFLI